ncbi:dockerin type I domain-containing protein [Rubripirellula reticaptiva]|uniref:Bifunctional hemolysin/adenylate cyclase n=1 Tax=Rubripirellula reticaptiva TaxID=2528013 RepID=A0A5C6FBF7_9BACT|nr:dockerin type I domain-containing protein [Rubripirellula reticaptiva]TWU57910.1 Bifunctional hemolysin/adenylate cyclase precursor [Rubripirellula reticaptiva]
MRKPRKQAASSKRRHLFERLEDRRLLAGDFRAGSLSSQESDLLFKGLDNVAQFAGLVAGDGVLNQPISMLQSDGASVSLGQIADPQVVFVENVLTPLQANWQSLQPRDRTSTKLIELLETTPGLTADGGLVGGGLFVTGDEWCFDLRYEKSFGSTVLVNNLGDDAEALEITVSSPAEILVAGRVIYDFTFGIDLTAGLSDEQAFFVRDASIAVNADVDDNDASIDLLVGYLGSDDSSLDIDLQSKVLIEFVDVDPDPLNNVTLSELNGYGAAAANVRTIEDQFTANITVTATLGDWTADDAVFLTFAGTSFDRDSVTLETQGLEQLAPFLATDATESVTGLFQFAQWISDFQASGALSVEVPLMRNVNLSDLFDFGNRLSQRAESLVDAETQEVTFDSIQAFATLFGATATFDPATSQLSFPIAQTFAPTTLEKKIQFASPDSPLSFLKSDSVVTTDINSSISFDWVIDLSDAEAMVAQKYAVKDLRITTDTSANPTTLAGDGVFGAFGFDFAEGTFSSTSGFVADILDPTTGNDQVSILNLYAGLGDHNAYFDDGLRVTGQTDFAIGGLSIQDELFTLPTITTMSVSQFSSSLPRDPNVVTAGSDMLDRLRDLTMQDVYDAIDDAFDAVIDIGLRPVKVIETVPVKIEQIIDTGLQAAGREGISEIYAKIDELAGEAAKIQLLTDNAIDDVWDDFSDVADAAIDLTVDATNGVIDIAVSIENAAKDVAIDLIVDTAKVAVDTLQWIAGGSPSSAIISNTMNIDLRLVLDEVATTEAHISDTSGFQFEIFIDDEAPDVEGSLGVLGITLEDGSIVIADNANSPDPDSPATFHVCLQESPDANGYLIAEADDAGIEVVSQGQLKVDYQVRQTASTTPQPQRMTFRVSELDDETGSIQITDMPDFIGMIDGLDLTDELAGLPSPLVGGLGSLADALDIGVFGLDLPLIGNALTGPANKVRELQQKLKVAFDDLTSFDLNAMQCAIAEALGVNCNLADTVVRFVTDDEDDITFRIKVEEVIAQQTINLDSNLGWDALGADLNTEFVIEGNYELDLTFGINRNEVYLRTDNEVINVGIDVTMERLSNDHNFEGRLGVLNVGLDLVGVGGPDVDLADKEVKVGQAAKIFRVDFDVDLIEPSGDDRLTMGEALAAFGSPNNVINFDTSIPNQGTRLTGGTGAKAGDVVTFALTTESSLPGTQWMPSVVGKFSMGWHFDGSNITGQAPTIKYEDVGIDLNEFFGGVVGNFLDHFGFFLDPAKPVVDALTEPIKIFQDMVDAIDPSGSAMLELSILDLADLYARSIPVDNGFKDHLQKLITFIDALDVLIDLRESTNGLNGEILYVGDVSLVRTAEGASQEIYDIANEVAEANGILDFLEVNSLYEAVTKAISATDENAAKAESEGVRFPVLEHPTSILGWLLGFNQTELITYEMPSVDVTIPLALLIPIPGIEVGLVGSINVTSDFRVGVDTLGLAEFAKSGRVADIAKGFYISDRENSDGTGEDIPQFTVTGTAALRGGVGLTFDLGDEISVGVGTGVNGGLRADINFDFIDNDNDGKIRGDDFSSPQSCMVISGGIEAFAEADVKVGFAKKVFPIASEPLVEPLNHEITCGGSVIGASLLARVTNETLFLLAGDLAIERSVMPTATNEAFTVRQGATENLVVVEAFGVTQVIDTDITPVTSIYVDAGDDFDVITIDESVTIPARIIGGSGTNHLTGGGGDDTIIGGNENDVIHGGGGADTITTGNGLNYVYGGPGRDTITGGDDIDVIEGEDGNDTIHGGKGDDVIHGGNGTDVLSGEAGFDYISGGNGFDTISGGADDDELFGDNGDDTIDGDDGDDYIEGGNGLDTIHGNDGIDTIFGGPDDDTINGNAGNDLLDGGDGDDTISGGSGLNTIWGRAGDDSLAGGSEKDIIRGGTGDDTIVGYLGDDELYGEADDDSIYGYSLLDFTLTDGQTDKDFIDGGAGNDKLFGGADDDLMLGGNGFDDIHGGAGDDDLDGGEDADEIFGELGDDTIDGGNGNDTIQGNEGDDLVRGGDGDDTIEGNDGDDTIYGDADDDVIRGGLGNDFADGGTGRDSISGNEGNDALFGNSGFDRIEGNDGDDEVSGNRGDDLIYGDNGKDYVEGGDGNDTIRGGNDNDDLNGGPGDDLILGHYGDDTIRGDEGNDVLKGYFGRDTIEGGPGNDRIDGQQDSDTLRGGDGDDIIEGGPADDRLEGDDGNDQLHGDDGRDELFGGNDDDYLWAGQGVGNLLDGGPGDDTIIGSDEGRDDPDPSDTRYFGDVIFGGLGNDNISGLGGSDVIDGGEGNDTINGGNHADIITGGPEDLKDIDDDDQVLGGLGDDTITGGSGTDDLRGGEGINLIDGNLVAYNPLDPDPVPSFAMNVGDEVAGDWEQLSGSATITGPAKLEGGLTRVGGIEQAIYTDEDGVYVAWVDFRNGNSEIYVARHLYGTGVWQEIGGSASGGGISNDSEQSRRPTITKLGDDIMVAWTKIDGNDFRNIETAFVAERTFYRKSTATRAVGDHAELMRYGEFSVLLGWINTPIDEPSRVQIDQYSRVDCFDDYISTVTPSLPAVPSTLIDQEESVIQFDLAIIEDYLAIGVTLDQGEERAIKISFADKLRVFNQTTLCGGGPAMLVPSPHFGLMTDAGYFDEDDSHDVSVAVRIDDSQGTGPLEREVRLGVQGMWARTSDREDQIEAHVYTVGDSAVPLWQEILQSSTGNATSLSDTVGYTSLPTMVQDDESIYAAYFDDSVHQDGSSLGRIYYVTDQLGDVISTVEEGTPTGAGISETGGAIKDLTIGKDEGNVVVAWTELRSGQPQIFLRTDLQDYHVDPTPYQNKRNRFDVNDDGEVTALDALQIINEISRRGLGTLPRGLRPIRFIDANGDNEVTALDALQIINRLGVRSSESEQLARRLGLTTNLDKDDESFVYDAAIIQLF